ncbi:host-nuclease inhibitor Gam family protein [Bradyrhizobium sp. 31Argb]|uniref:host-nuclease inhibitor Gam family protein n=1 Tax=Bradyrhizobium sp. 31Argb TaxID=3141247 RepID=UPI00374846EE
MAKRSKAAAADMRIPQNRDEVAEMIAKYGEKLREIELIETGMNESLAKVKTDAEQEAAPHVDAAEKIFRGLQIYCEANRQALLGDTGLKTAKFPTGNVSWRWKPAKVTLKGEHDAIIARILEKQADALARGETGENYANFLRLKREIDKDSMLKNPDLARTIDGVRIGSGGETFEIEPFGAQLSEAAE